jgi:hypothetical protein
MPIAVILASYDVSLLGTCVNSPGSVFAYYTSKRIAGVSVGLIEEQLITNPKLCLVLCYLQDELS